MQAYRGVSLMTVLRHAGCTVIIHPFRNTSVLCLQTLILRDNELVKEL